MQTRPIQSQIRNNPHRMHQDVAAVGVSADASGLYKPNCSSQLVAGVLGSLSPVYSAVLICFQVMVEYENGEGRGRERRRGPASRGEKWLTIVHRG